MIRSERQREVQLSHLMKAIQYSSCESAAPSTPAPRDRLPAVSYLMAVAHTMQLLPEALYRSVDLLDRFLSVTPGVPFKMLHLVCLTCVYVAAKEDEVQHVPLAHLIRTTGCPFTKQDIVRMESVMLGALDWQVRSPTALDFLQLYIHAIETRTGAPVSPVIQDLANYHLELSLLDSRSAGYAASMTAMSALLLAHTRLQPDSVQSTVMPLLPLASIHLVQLDPCIQNLADMHAATFKECEATEQLQPVVTKYCQAKHYHVACITPLLG